MLSRYEAVQAAMGKVLVVVAEWRLCNNNTIGWVSLSKHLPIPIVMKPQSVALLNWNTNDLVVE
jgi:hypothetical protein